LSKIITIWLLVWYFLGFLYMVISFLPSVSVWNIQESLNFEDSSLNIESKSIVQVLVSAALWPIILVALLTVGLLIGGEVVGYEYSSNIPLLILLYYIKVVQAFLILFLTGILSGIIALLLIRQRIFK
ncbi:MAG: hypothetical protein ACFFAM_20150, partial [Promethearchaeota archaeon]